MSVIFSSPNLKSVYQDKDALVVWKSAGLVVRHHRDAKCPSVEKYLKEIFNAKPFWVVNNMLTRSSAGLVVVALNEQSRLSILKTLTGVYRALVLQRQPTCTEQNPLPGCIRVCSRTSGNNGTYATIDVDRFGVEQVSGCGLRKQLAEVGCSVIGKQARWTASAKSSPSNGIFLALIRVTFVARPNENVMSIEVEEPPKFESFRARERQFYLAKQARKQKLIEEGHNVQLTPLNSQPVSYQLGYAQFAGHRFKVNQNVMIPRQSTELLVREYRNLFERKAGIRILDLGTGCGCLLISCLKLSSCASGVGIDISKDALEVAQTNAEQHRVADRASFVQGDFELIGDSLGDQVFDAILCNPPYLSSPLAIDESLRGWEPPEALYASNDGLAAYEKLLRGIQSSSVMAPGCVILVETGKRVAGRAKELFSGSFDCKACPDLHGMPRLLVLSNPQKFTHSHKCCS